MIRRMQKKDLKGVKLLIQSVPGLWHDIYTDETIARAFVSSEDLTFVYDSNGQIVGGIFALRRRVWGLALAGAICAFLVPAGFILGILAIIFVAMGKREFE